mgnify:CR=1 FL=1
MKYSLLYIIAVALVILQLAGYPGLILAVLLTMIIMLLNAIDSARKIEETNTGVNARIGDISNRVNVITQQLNEMKSGAEKNVFALENRIDEVKTEYRIEMESQYRDLAKKIIEVENRLIEIRKTIGAAFGSLEDRLESR